MKKIITLTAAALLAISASAQSEAGSLTWKPNVGITYTTATGFLGKYSDGAVGVTAGVEAMYMLKEKFGTALGLNYTGYNVSDKYGDSDGSICTIIISIFRLLPAIMLLLVLLSKLVWL